MIDYQAGTPDSTKFNHAVRNDRALTAQKPNMGPFLWETPRQALHSGQKYRQRFPQSLLSSRKNTLVSSFLQCGHIGVRSSFFSVVIIKFRLSLLLY